MRLADPVDHVAAARLAEEAGKLLLDIRAGIGTALTAEQAKDEGDRRSHDLLLTRLAALYPRDAVLSEEGADDPVRLGAERVWIIDPLDGTREFGEPGRADWAVHVALVIGDRPVAGAVALPARDMVLSTERRLGAPPRRDGPPRLAVSRSRPPVWARSLADDLGAQLLPMGSAGAKAMAVVLGEAEAYVHAGGQHEWDSAAPVAVALAAGLWASRLDGSALAYNQPDTWLPDLLICRPELAEPVIASLG